MPLHHVAAWFRSIFRTISSPFNTFQQFCQSTRCVPFDHFSTLAIPSVTKFNRCVSSKALALCAFSTAEPRDISSTPATQCPTHARGTTHRQRLRQRLQLRPPRAEAAAPPHLLQPSRGLQSSRGPQQSLWCTARLKWREQCTTAAAGTRQ